MGLRSCDRSSAVSQCYGHYHCIGCSCSILAYVAVELLVSQLPAYKAFAACPQGIKCYPSHVVLNHMRQQSQAHIRTKPSALADTRRCAFHSTARAPPAWPGSAASAAPSAALWHSTCPSLLAVASTCSSIGSYIRCGQRMYALHHASVCGAC